MGGVRQEATAKTPGGLVWTGGFAREIRAATGVIVNRCFQCKKCTAGCPVARSMDLLPHRVIRLCQLGQKDAVLRSATVWICASCRACQARCPNGLDIPRIMDYLKSEVLRQGAKVAQPRVNDFHRSFLDTVRTYGRAHELTMIGIYKLRSGALLDDLGMGLGMLRRGRLPLLPEIIRGRRQIRRLFRRARELSSGERRADAAETGKDSDRP